MIASQVIRRTFRTLRAEKVPLVAGLVFLFKRMLSGAALIVVSS